MKSTVPIIENDLFIIRTLLLIIGILCFVLGILTVSYEWRNIGSFLLLVSVFMFSNFILLNLKYKAYKKVYLEYLPIEKTSEMLNHGTFEFTNEYLIYKSKKVSEKIKWTNLLNYKLVDSKHIVIFRKDTSGTNLIISQTEMDSSGFKTIIELIKENLPELKIYRKYEI